MKRTAKEIINDLPSMCYTVNDVSRQVIIVKAGVIGFFQGLNIPNSLLPKELRIENYPSLLDVSVELGRNKSIADWLNEGIGVTKAQSEAMKWGSIFGFDNGMADPLNYDENGIPYSEKNPRKEAK